MKEDGINWNKFHIPAWIVTLVILTGAFVNAKADVSNLKTENVQIKQDVKALSEAVPAMQADIRNIRAQVDKMDGKLDQLIQRGTR